MTTGNIDQPAICIECAVLTTLDSVQQICWECWIRISEELEQQERQLRLSNDDTEEE